MTRGSQIFQTKKPTDNSMRQKLDTIELNTDIHKTVYATGRHGALAPWVYTHLIVAEINIFCLIEYCISGKLDKVLFYMVQIFK